MTTEKQALGVAEIEDRLLLFMRTELMDPDTLVDRTTPLLSGEVLDSMSVLRLASYVQDEFRIVTGPADFTVGNFRDVAALAGYVRRSLDGGLAGPSGP
jgi:hypothetical protein